MVEWETYKRAAIEYAKLRPRTVFATLTPVAGTRSLPLPSGCLGVLQCDYGIEGSIFEITTVGQTAQGWAVLDGTLYLNPATSAGAVIALVYTALYPANDATQTISGVPPADVLYLEDLEQAILLELDATAIAGGPVKYSVGQTQVDRADGVKHLTERARTLRERVHQALDEPLALWR